jgi:hypothetical protein
VKFKLEFRDLKGELVFVQEADMPEGGSINWGPCKVGISVDGGPVHDIEGHLNIHEDLAMIAPVDLGASAAVLNVTHHEPEEEQ